MRRHTRRGMARCILEAEARGDEGYFESHPIAAEHRGLVPKRRLERWATERNPTTGTGIMVFGMEVDVRHPKAATWPKR